jgi:hypothetical protein
MKEACRKEDEINTRRFKVAQILKSLDYSEDKKRESAINAFSKSNMSLEEIEEFAKIMMKNTEYLNASKNKTTPGVA